MCETRVINRLIVNEAPNKHPFSALVHQITTPMKTIAYLLIMFIYISCNTQPDFYFGTWELNKQNGLSTMSLSDSKVLNWYIAGIRIYKNMPFIVVQITPQKYNIVFGQGTDCIKLTLQRLTEHMSIGCIYKCYINENMIDEVFIAR